MKITVERGSHWQSSRRHRDNFYTARLQDEDGTELLSVRGDDGVSKESKQSARRLLLSEMYECIRAPIIVIPRPGDDRSWKVMIARRTINNWIVSYDGSNNIHGWRNLDPKEDVAYPLAMHAAIELPEEDLRREDVYKAAESYGVDVKKLRKEVASYDAWQARYRKAELLGANDPHACAGKSPALRDGTRDWDIMLQVWGESRLPEGETTAVKELHEQHPFRRR